MPESFGKVSSNVHEKIYGAHSSNATFLAGKLPALLMVMDFILGYVVNHHGDRCCTLRIGLDWTPTPKKWKADPNIS